MSNIHIRFEDGSFFRKAVECISSIVSEVNMVITPYDIQIQAMDLSHICLVSFTLLKEDCDEYEVDKDYSLGLNMEDLVKVCKRLKPKMELALNYTTKEHNLLELSMKPPEAKRYKTFKLALIDIEGEEINMESLKEPSYPNTFSVDIGLIKEAVEDVE